MGGIFGCDDDGKTSKNNIIIKEVSTNERSKKSSESGSKNHENIKHNDQKNKRDEESKKTKSKKKSEINKKNKNCKVKENEEELKKEVFNYKNNDDNNKKYSNENKEDGKKEINDIKKEGDYSFQINKNITANNKKENIKINDEEVINLNKRKEKENEKQQNITSNKKRKNKTKLLEQNEEKESQKNSELSDKNNNEINFEGFLFLGHYDSLKNIPKSKEDGEKENNILINYFKKNKLKKNLYKKKDFIDKNEFIYIQYQDKTLNFLFPKNRFKDKNLKEENIMEEIKESLFCEKIDKQFNINLNSKDKIFSLEKINNSNNKFNLHIEDITNNEKIIGFNNQSPNNKDNNNDEIQNKNINKDNNIDINKNNDKKEESNKTKNNDENNEKIKTDIVLKKEVKNEYLNNILKKENNIVTNNNLNNNSIINNSSNINNKENNNNLNINNNSNIDNNSDINNKANNNNLNIKNSNINNNTNNNKIDNNIKINNKKIEVFYFPIVGLTNVGSTCFMNATLQCLIHIPELSLYFLNEYQKDKEVLNNKNITAKTKGHLSEAYYEVVKNVDDISKREVTFSYSSYRPKNFKEILGTYNSQFSKYEANDSKDLILYLLQTLHEELNYFGDKSFPVIQPIYPVTRESTYQFFNLTYNTTNFSKISQLFYGTYENTIICSECKTIYYSYQKYEYISFSTYNYLNKNFEIKNGFTDIESKQNLEGENKYYCNKCKKLVNAETYCKIIDFPNYLILNIDYGKDKKFNVKELIFEHEMDVKDFCSFYFGQKTKYKLVSICTHKGSSGPNGHYYAYCLNKKIDKWYIFDDTSCKECDKYELRRHSPYLLIYELI